MGGDIVSEETRKDVITLSHVGMEFHLNKEKVDSLKEYFIKLVKHDIAYSIASISFCSPLSSPA